MRDLDFNRHFDVDEMLSETANWLAKQINLPLKDFLKIAEQIDLRQEDWDTFWKKIREAEKKVEKQEKNIESYIECYIMNKRYNFTEEEFEVVKQILNCLDPKEYSSCCNSQVKSHTNTHIGECKKCGKVCRVIYEF